MVVRGVVATIDITHTIRVVDVGKMVKPQYEANVNLSLFATFVAFVAFSSHPTIGKGKNQ
jgi:hypothetical protein